MLTGTEIMFLATAAVPFKTEVPSWATPPPVTVGEQYNRDIGQQFVSYSIPEDYTYTIDKNKLIDKLYSYLDLGDDWDGYGGKAPSLKAILEATNFLKSLKTKVLPYPMLSGDGEVGLYWEQDGYFVDIGFYGDGEYSYYAEGPNLEPLSSDHSEVSMGLDAELEEFLSNLS